jgi:hypothetical protein
MTVSADTDCGTGKNPVVSILGIGYNPFIATDIVPSAVSYRFAGCRAWIRGISFAGSPGTEWACGNRITSLHYSAAATSFVNRSTAFPETGQCRSLAIAFHPVLYTAVVTARCLERDFRSGVKSPGKGEKGTEGEKIGFSKFFDLQDIHNDLLS